MGDLYVTIPSKLVQSAVSEDKVERNKVVCLSIFRVDSVPDTVTLSP